MTIAVLGSANMDLVVRQSRLPLPGETIFGTSFMTVPGGKGLNQATAAARLGGNVEFIGAIGADDYGRALRRTLDDDGIGTSQLATVAETTGTAHIAVTDTGENSIVVVSGANMALINLSEDQRELIRCSRFLVLQFELPLSVISEALEVARGAGVFTALTPAPVQEIPTGMLDRVDLIVLNQLEALEITHASDHDDAARILSSDGRSVVITLGSAGCVVAKNGDILAKTPARRVAAVDTTAAGDTFVGALVARLAKGDDLVDAVTWATVAASISVTRHGATSSMPRVEEVAALLKRP